MVDDRLTDGRRIAELLAAELDGLGGALATVAVRDADRDATPSADGTDAYRVVLDGGPIPVESDGTADAEAGGTGETGVAVVFVHPDRARVEFVTGQDAAATAADEAGLRVRPKAVRPPRTLVFVENAVEVKRVVEPFEAVVSAVENGEAGAGPVR